MRSKGPESSKVWLTVLPLLLSGIMTDSTSDKIMMDSVSVGGSLIPLMCAGKLIRDDSGFLRN